MSLEFDASPEDLKVFLDEAEELLQVMEDDILQLEKEPENPEPLQEIFRAAHTLKGSSATLGHRRMAEVTHALENLLDKLRKGTLTATARVVDTLFACLDVLKTFKEEIATGEEAGIDTTEVLDRLTEVETLEAAGGSTAAATVAAGSLAPVAPVGLEGLPPLTRSDLQRLELGIARDLTPWWLVLSVVEGSPMPAVRFFQAILTLGEMGDVVRSWPDQGEIEADRVGTELKVLLLSGAGEEAVRIAMRTVPETRLSELVLLHLPPPGGGGDAEDDADGDRSAGETDGDQAAAARPARAGGAQNRVSRTVRVDVDVLDNLMNLVGELVIDRTRLLQIITHVAARSADDDLVRDLHTTAGHIGRVTGELQEHIMRARMMPVDHLFKKFPRMVRDVAQKAQREIQFVVRGEETELDRSVIEEIGDPLMHLLRNAVDHGVEPPMERLKAGKPARGTVVLEARHEENQIVISVRDDGRGMDPARLRAAAVAKGLLTEETARRLTDEEARRLIFLPGFSTAAQVSDISGRGVGLDVVHRNIERLNGAIQIYSELGQGTEFRIKLPLTLAIIRALMVDHQGTTYAVPLSAVQETIRWPVAQVQRVQGREVVVSRGNVVPLLRLESVFHLRPRGADEAPADGELFIVIVHLFGRQVGIVVDSLVGEGDVVIKSLGKYIGEIPGVSGATIMGDGGVAIILDVAGLIQRSSPVSAVEQHSA